MDQQFVLPAGMSLDLSVEAVGPVEPKMLQVDHFVEFCAFKTLLARSGEHPSASLRAGPARS